MEAYYYLLVIYFLFTSLNSSYKESNLCRIQKNDIKYELDTLKLFLKFKNISISELS